MSSSGPRAEAKRRARDFCIVMDVKHGLIFSCSADYASRGVGEPVIRACVSSAPLVWIFFILCEAHAGIPKEEGERLLDELSCVQVEGSTGGC